MIRNRLLAIASLSLLVAACSQVSEVKPGKNEVLGLFTVENSVAWNRISDSNSETWTLDGPFLQNLAFKTNISDGENIFREEGSEDGPNRKFRNMPKFRKGMTEPEIGEMIIASISQLGSANAKSLGMKPALFGGRNGFVIEIEFSEDDGLNKRMLVHGMSSGDKLHLVMFSAPALYYYDRDKPRVEKIVKSITFLKDS